LRNQFDDMNMLLAP